MRAPRSPGPGAGAQPHASNAAMAGEDVPRDPAVETARRNDGLCHWRPQSRLTTQRRQQSSARAAIGVLRSRSPVSSVRMGFVVLFAIDSVTALVLLGFFFWGLTDRSVSSFNSALARPIGSVAAILVGSFILRARVGRAWRMACLRFWLGPVV